MQIAFSNDGIDDAPDRAETSGFVGVDKATVPTLLPPGLLQDATNLQFIGDGLARPRPAFYLNVNHLTAAPASSDAVVRGLCYYDLPSYEGLLSYGDERLKDAPNNTFNAAATLQVTYGGAPTTGDVPFVQFVDRVFYLRNGVLQWTMNTAGVWTAGTLATFSDASSMPLWSRIVTQGFRLFLMEANGYKLYASAIGAAAVAANWVKTENIQVGSGEGDPARALIASQARFLTMLTARAAWQIDTTAATVAQWTSLRVSAEAGCVEGKTAVAAGQDVYFLSRYGIVNLASLSDILSIAPQATLSAPIQPYIDRINWSVVNTAFATTFSEYILFALPLDSDTRPKHFLPFNLRTRRWCGAWTFNPGTNALTGAAFTGFTTGVVCNFGDTARTVIADNTGRIFCLNTPPYSYSRDAIAADGTLLPFTCTAVTRAFHHEAPESAKQALQAEVEFKVASDSALYSHTLTLTSEANNTTTVSGGFTVGGGAAPGAINRNRFNLRGVIAEAYREAFLTITDPNGRMLLRSATVTAYIDPPQRTG